jgi:hypothetical protein
MATKSNLYSSKSIWTATRIWRLPRPRPSSRHGYLPYYTPRYHNSSSPQSRTPWNVRSRNGSSTRHVPSELSTARPARRLPTKLPTSRQHAQYQFLRSRYPTRHLRTSEDTSRCTTKRERRFKKSRSRLWTECGIAATSPPRQSLVTTTSDEGRDSTDHLCGRNYRRLRW